MPPKIRAISWKIQPSKMQQRQLPGDSVTRVDTTLDYKTQIQHLTSHTLTRFGSAPQMSLPCVPVWLNTLSHRMDLNQPVFHHTPLLPGRFRQFVKFRAFSSPAA